MLDNFSITVDISTAQMRAEQVRNELTSLRSKYDLSNFEYCKSVSIAPLQVPYSHPQIILNTFVHGEHALLSNYLHEQMHWYLTWYSYAKSGDWSDLLEELKLRYPDVPAADAGGARDEESTYLHLIVNWLEIETASLFVDRNAIEKHVSKLPYYKWIYGTVLSNWILLEQLYKQYNLLPVKPASQMSVDELKLASSFDER